MQNNNTDSNLSAVQAAALWLKPTYITAKSNVTNSTVTLADAAGYSFPVAANSLYYFRFVVTYSVSTALTGANFSVNGPALSSMGAVVTVPTATSTFLSKSITAYNVTTTATTSNSTANNVATVEGFITCSSGGTVILRFASGVAATSVTVNAASISYQILT